MEAGLLLDYLSISQTQTPNIGLGARFGYRVHHRVMLEGELAYDYGVNFNELYVNVANGNAAAIARTSIGVTDGTPRTDAPARPRPLAPLCYPQGRLH